MKKRFLSLLLALTFLAGCSGTPDSSSSPDSVSGEQSSQQTNNEEDSSVEKYNVTETAEGYVTEVNTKSVRFLGRVYQNLIKNDDYFAFGSSGIEFKFTGTKLEAEIITNSPSVKFEDQQRVAVYIDDMDEPYKVISLEEYRIWYTIAENLSDSEHLVKIVKICGYGQRLQVSVPNLRTDKNTVKPSDKREIKIEFVGDSITAGHGIEGGTANSRSVENSELTYAALTAKHFNADYNIVARSGVSLTFAYGGGKGDFKQMYEAWDYYHGKSDNNKWDFNADPVDIVVINVGTNDYWAGIANKAGAEGSRQTFTNDYIEFLKFVREKNPNATIIAGLGPMSYHLMEEIENAVDAMDDNGIHAVKLEPQNPASTDGVGTENHPSIATNKKVSETLIKAIQKFTGLE
jgi:lysophospholipase L1-like esterase